MTTSPQPLPPAGNADLRDRLLGYLTAMGVDTPAAREKLLASLSEVARGSHHEGPGLATLGVANLLAWFDGWQQRVAERIADHGSTPSPSVFAAVRQWLSPHWGRLLSLYPEAVSDAEAESALIAHARADLPSDVYPPVPTAHPQDMPRQPLGDLPAVLRAEFWGGTYRWILPTRFRQQRDRLPIESKEPTPG